jgi:hypothetical protein
VRSALAALLVVAALVVAPSRSAATELPVIARGEGVVVRAERGLDDLAANIARRAPATLAAIAADLEGLPRPPLVEIRVVVDTSEIASVSPSPGVPEWAVGVAFAGAGVVVVAVRRGSEMLDVLGTVDHELAHMALGAALGGRAPRWLNEGFAYLHSSDWSLARFRTLIGMAWSGDVIPLSELDRSFPAAEQSAHRAYAQSYDFVAFLARRGRFPDADDDGNRWPFRRFLALVAAGKSTGEASLEAFGTRLSDLFDEWRRNLRSRYLMVPAELFGLGVWCFGALLLIIAYIRRRMQNRETLARWAAEEEEKDRAREAAIQASGTGST